MTGLIKRYDARARIYERLTERAAEREDWPSWHTYKAIAECWHRAAAELRQYSEVDA